MSSRITCCQITLSSSFRANVAPKNSSLESVCKYARLPQRGQLSPTNTYTEEKLSTAEEFWLDCYVNEVIWENTLDEGTQSNQILPPHLRRKLNSWMVVNVWLTLTENEEHRSIRGGQKTQVKTREKPIETDWCDKLMGCQDKDSAQRSPHHWTCSTH